MDVFKTLLLDTPDSLNAITGTLQISNGGTGATDAAGARDNLLPDYTGNVGKVLTVNAGATDVEWTTNGAGTVTSVDLTAGTGVSVSGGPITSSGSITVTNTAPDQTVVLTAGTGINTSGTYPSFTVTNSAPDQTVVLTAGTGINTSGTYPNFTVTNSAPDQTVAIAAGTGISVSGSYPSFTVTNSSPSLGGDVVGPASATDNAIVRFDSTTGKLVQNSGVTISDANLLTTTDLTVNDDTTLGSSNSDTVNFNARVASDINPATDNTYDLGVTGHEWRNLNIDGTANIDSLAADTADIDGGTIDATAIGATTPSTVAATTLSASGASTFTNSAPSVIGGLGFRNRIINGDMRIDQRNEGASVTLNSSLFYNIDRWAAVTQTNSTGTMQRVADAPSGFVNSLKYTVSTAQAPSAGNFNQFETKLEGLNVADFAFGTASAKTITLSFWVKSSLTGTFGLAIDNAPGSIRNYVSQYTINSANTWELKSIVIPGDTSGTWATSNAAGIRVLFDLGSGSSQEGTANAWSTSNFRRVSGNVTLINNTAATWNLTGVQLEIGNAATEFERRPFGQELILCQRYLHRASYDSGNAFFAVGQTQSSTQVTYVYPFPVTMRATPTVTFSAAGNFFAQAGGGNATPSAMASSDPTVNTTGIVATVSGATPGYASILIRQTGTAFVQASAEL
jgi:hypothetical protein